MNELKNLLEYQIRSELYLNEIREDSFVVDRAIENCIDGWDIIFDMIYKEFPELKKRYDIADYVYFIFGMIYEFKSEKVLEKEEWISDCSEMMAGLIYDYCSKNAELVKKYGRY